MIISNSEKDSDFKINPDGGFEHFGMIKNDYIIVKGSVPGVPKRLVKMRFPIRTVGKKISRTKSFGGIGEMKVTLKDLRGKEIESLELPSVFNTPLSTRDYKKSLC